MYSEEVEGLYSAVAAVPRTWNTLYLQQRYFWGKKRACQTFPFGKECLIEKLEIEREQKVENEEQFPHF